MIWDWAFAFDVLPTLLRATLVTLQATLLATIVTLVLGLVLALLRRSRWRVLRWPTAAFIEVIRSTPLLIQLYFVFYQLPQSGIALAPMTAGVIGLGVHYATYTSEVYRAGIEDIPRGQWEASTALNLSRARTWVTIVIPQVIPRVVPALTNYVVQMFKATPLLAAITVVELLGQAQITAAQTYRYLEPITLVGVIFLLLSYPTAWGARALERKFRVRH